MIETHDGCSIFLRNVSHCLPKYTASYHTTVFFWASFVGGESLISQLSKIIIIWNGGDGTRVYTTRVYTTHYYNCNEGLKLWNLEITVCTRANNFHIETVKYLINKNYIILILVQITCLILSNCFRKSTDHKQRVNKKQNWCMCVRASYMKLTRDTHLMQQFIYYYK